MRPVHDESVFGTAVVAAMLERGRRAGNPGDYRPDLGPAPDELYDFIRATRPDEWQELAACWAGSNPRAPGRGRTPRCAP
jgi:type I restriction enzyme R subunit